MFFKYPYTNLYNLNLDWIIQAIKEMQEIVEPLDRVVNSVNGMTGDVTLTRDLLMQILGGLVTKFNGRDGNVELTAEDVNATLIDITWTSDPGETVADLTQAQLDAMFASGFRILIFVNNLGVADQVYFLQWYDSHAQPQEYSPTAALAGVASFNGMTGNVTVTGDDLETSAADTKTIAESLAEKVPETRTINNIPLSTNVSLDAEDIPSQAITGATDVEMALGNLNASKVPNARTVNGESLLNDIVLNDEDIPSDVDGKTNVKDVLTYQSEEIADLNEEIPDKADVIISSASGSVASFADGADGLPVESLKVAIEPVQAGSGDPSPENVRPITGWTGAKVTRTGKNLAGTKITDRFPSGNPPAAQVVYVSGGIVYEAYIKQGGNYTITAYGGDRFGVYVADKPISEFASLETISLPYSRNREGSEVTKYSYTLSNVPDNKYIGVYASSSSGGDSVVMIEKGSEESTYEPYQGQTYDITIPTEAGTVYGGTLDATGGVLTVDRAMVDLGSLNWVKWENTQKGFYGPLPNSKGTIGSDSIANGISNKYKPGTYNNVVRGYTDNSFAIAATKYIYLYDSSYQDSDAAAFKTAMSGVQLVYERDTPITYTLTPTEITTLLGLNNIWADAGDVDVSYKADTKLYIDQQMAELGPVNDLNSDSTTAALAAAQGKALKTLIDGLTTPVSVTLRTGLTLIRLGRLRMLIVEGANPEEDGRLTTLTSDLPSITFRAPVTVYGPYYNGILALATSGVITAQYAQTYAATFANIETTKVIYGTLVWSV